MTQSAGLHEPAESMSPAVIDRHRAIASLQEELEAIDWYDQRVAATDDQSLAEILAHNRDEEKEHAAMVLEWLRRRDPEFDGFLRRYLFTDGSITGLEEAVESGGNGSGNGATLGIGSLRKGAEQR